MIILHDIELKYKNVIDVIKKCQNKDEKIKLIVALVKDIGGRCVSLLARLLGIARQTIKKYTKVSKNRNKTETRGRKAITLIFPNLENDIRKIVDEYASTDPDFNTEKRYVRLTINEIRNRLIETNKYTDETCPKKSCLANLLNKMGYNLKKVKKTKPLKKIEETDNIFTNIRERKELAINSDNVVLISIDTKDKVLIGPYSRRGKSRTQIEAVDHELTNNCLIPFGILDIKTSTPYFYNFVHKPTSEAIVDCIELFWQTNYVNSNKNKLAILLDNGPDNSGIRTYFLKCLVDLSKKYNLLIELIYYPPYHSKYNPVERLWARLENIWNGSLLTTTDICLSFMKNLTWKGNKSETCFIEKEYEKGLKVENSDMKHLEKFHITRNPKLKKWSILISP